MATPFGTRMIEATGDTTIVTKSQMQTLRSIHFAELI